MGFEFVFIVNNCCQGLCHINITFYLFLFRGAGEMMTRSPVMVWTFNNHTNNHFLDLSLCACVCNVPLRSLLEMVLIILQFLVTVAGSMTLEKKKRFVVWDVHLFKAFLCIEVFFFHNFYPKHM